MEQRAQIPRQLAAFRAWEELGGRITLFARAGPKLGQPVGLRITHRLRLRQAPVSPEGQ